MDGLKCRFMYKGELAELLKPKPISWVIKRTKLKNCWDALNAILMLGGYKCCMIIAWAALPVQMGLHLPYHF